MHKNSIEIINFLNNANDTDIGSLVTIPSDKSISHRAVIFASLAGGETYVENLLYSADVQNTILAFKTLGVKFEKIGEVTKIKSKGGISFNNNVSINKCFNIHLGNSGTSCRLLMGVFIGILGKHCFYGDSSLSNRPMKRVIDPLTQMGGRIKGTCSIDYQDLTLPVTISGSYNLKNLIYTSNIPSAQVKSAILFASLWTRGTTEVTEAIKTRDHTENMMRFLGLDIQVKGNSVIANATVSQIKPFNYKVPKDFSSVAFFIVFALLSNNKQSTFTGINVNSLRTGLLDVLKLMNAKISLINMCSLGGEQVADIVVYRSTLRGCKVPDHLVSNMIDEFPILFVLSALIQGETTYSKLEELKFKESDRLSVMLNNFSKLGILFTKHEDGCTITGGISQSVNKQDIIINTHKDHRIAMSFVIMSAFYKSHNFIIDDIDCISTSFPEFIENCKILGFSFNYLTKKSQN